MISKVPPVASGEAACLQNLHPVLMVVDGKNRCSLKCTWAQMVWFVAACNAGIFNADQHAVVHEHDGYYISDVSCMQCTTGMMGSGKFLDSANPAKAAKRHLTI
eukprot:1158168-Pelagomonas_calceolata.AAC.8